MTENLPDISIRAMEPEDLDMLYRIENDSEIWSVSNTNVPYSRYTLHDYIASASNDIYVDRQVRLIVETASEGKTVGLVDVVNFDPRHRRAEVGIVIVKEYRNRGFARAALLKIHSYAQQVLHLHQLYAIIHSANNHALSLFYSLGYNHVAVIPEWLYDGDSYSQAIMVQKLLIRNRSAF